MSPGGAVGDFYAPTILLGVTLDMRIWNEEACYSSSRLIIIISNYNITLIFNNYGDFIKDLKSWTVSNY